MINIKSLNVFFACLFISNLIGQKPIKLKTEDKEENTKEIFYATPLKNSFVKNGSYKKYYFKDLQIEGFYKNDLKDSLWNEYYYDGKSIEKTGYYKNGIQIGEWKEFYFDGKSISSIENYENGLKNGSFKELYKNGELKASGYYSNGMKSGIWEFYTTELYQKYDYDNKKLLYFNPKDFKEEDYDYPIINGSDTTIVKLDSPCMYVGGMTPIYNFIAKNVNYPNQAVENNISGKVYISFTVDSNGNAYNHEIQKGIKKDYGCNEEAIRVVKSIPNEWLPAILNGKTVENKFIIPINFKLE